MIGENQELHDYVTSAEGISRKGLNIMCFIGVFILGNRTRNLHPSYLYRRLGPRQSRPFALSEPCAEAHY